MPEDAPAPGTQPTRPRRPPAPRRPRFGPGRDAGAARAAPGARKAPPRPSRLTLSLVIGGGAIVLWRHQQPSRSRRVSGFQGAAGRSGRLPVVIGSLRGRPAVITLWGSWCEVCGPDLSQVASLVPRYRGRVVFVAGDYRDTPQKAKTYLQRRHNSLLDLRASQLKALLPHKPPRGLSETVFVDGAGRVTHVHLGAYRSAGALEHDIATYTRPASRSGSKATAPSSSHP